MRRHAFTTVIHDGRLILGLAERHSPGYRPAPEWGAFETEADARRAADAQNRELAERQQQHYERMAFDTKNQEMSAANEAMYGDRSAQQAQRRQRSDEAAADWQKAKDTGSIGFGAFTGLAGSDPRLKMNVGSLAHLTRRAGR